MSSFILDRQECELRENIARVSVFPIVTPTSKSSISPSYEHVDTVAFPSTQLLLHSWNTFIPRINTHDRTTFNKDFDYFILDRDFSDVLFVCFQKNLFFITFYNVNFVVDVNRVIFPSIFYQSFPRFSSIFCTMFLFGFYSVHFLRIFKELR